MGNCLRNSKVSAAQDHHNNDTFSHEMVKALPMLSKLEAEQSMKKKKVRFMVQNGGEGERGCDGEYCRSGGVRIRVVMSQEELKRMLRCKDEGEYQSSMEQLLLHAVKLRGGRVSCDDEGINSSWKPSLDSIPEDCFMNSK